MNEAAEKKPLVFRVAAELVSADVTASCLPVGGKLPPYASRKHPSLSRRP
jgi:hypothetical protein